MLLQIVIVGVFYSIQELWELIDSIIKFEDVFYDLVFPGDKLSGAIEENSLCIFKTGYPCINVVSSLLIIRFINLSLFL